MPKNSRGDTTIETTHATGGLRTYTVSSTWCTLKYTPKYRRKPDVGGLHPQIPTPGNIRPKRHRYKVSSNGTSSKARQAFRLTTPSWMGFVRQSPARHIFKFNCNKSSRSFLKSPGYVAFSQFNYKLSPRDFLKPGWPFPRPTTSSRDPFCCPADSRHAPSINPSASTGSSF